MFISSTSLAASAASPYAARESFPPENETVTGRFLLFPSSRNLLISLTAVLWILLTCPRLESTNVLRSASGDTGMPDGALRSRILTALSASRMDGLSSRAVPGPTFPPFFSIRGPPFEKSPSTEVMFAPGTTFPLRCPDMPANVTILLVATGANSSAPGCFRSSIRRWERRS